jgi:malic enzyme
LPTPCMYMRVAQGRECRVSQANNMYIFPGVALGAFLGQTGNITDAMLMAAAEALPGLMSEDELRAGIVYPKCVLDKVQIYKFSPLHVILC